MSQAPHHAVPEWTQGDRLRKSLDHAGITVAEMAAYLETSRNTVGNYLADRTRVPGLVMRQWALRTGVPRSWLETGKTPGQPEPDGGLKVLRTRRDSTEHSPATGVRAGSRRLRT